MITILVILAGGLGALTRWTVGGLVHRRIMAARPWGTAVVNLSGTLALGLLAAAGAKVGLSPNAVRVLGVGFIGGYTTFSTWMVETLYLAEEGGAGRRAVLWNLFGLYGGGLFAVIAGLWLGRLLW